MFRTWLARWTCGARLTLRARRASGSRRLCINVRHAAVLLIGHGHRTGFASKHRLILWHTGLTWWSGWTCLIRIARWSRLPRLTLTCRPGLPALARRTLLALCLGECGINVPVDVPRLMIIVTAIAAAISRIVHVIHFSEP